MRRVSPRHDLREGLGRIASDWTFVATLSTRGVGVVPREERNRHHGSASAIRMRIDENLNAQERCRVGGPVLWTGVAACRTGQRVSKDGAEDKQSCLKLHFAREMKATPFHEAEVHESPFKICPSFKIS